jgi:GTPase SAR1 family protein
LTWTDVLTQWGNARGAAEAPASSLQTASMKDMRRYSLLRPKISIAMTGSPGAGKSVLYDALAGKTGGSYSPPGVSEHNEPHRIVLNGKRHIRANLWVIPGQPSDERRDAEEAAFGRNSYTTGVIYVVSWGRNEVWQQGRKDTIKDQIRDAGLEPTQGNVFQIEKNEELENFRRICNKLKDAWRNRSDVWLIVAVTKCDLFWKDLPDARDYYIPTSAELRGNAAAAKAKAARIAADHDPSSAELAAAANTAENEAETLADPARSAFADVLSDLVESLGWKSFRSLAVLPASAFLDTYTFDRGMAEVHPSLDDLKKNALTRHFLAKVGEFCGL